MSIIGVEGNIIVCQLESTNEKTVIFKFDHNDMSPEKIANRLVRKYF